MQSGKLESTSVYLTIAGFHRDRKTGRLRCFHGSDEAWIYFENGEIVGAFSSRPFEEGESGMRRVLLDIGAWTRTGWEFTPGEIEPLSPGPRDLSSVTHTRIVVNTAELLRGIGRETPFSLVGASLGDSLSRPLAMTIPLEELPHRMSRLTQEEFFLLSRVDGKLSAEAMLQILPGDRSKALSTLFGLLLAGIMEFGEVRRAATGGAAAPWRSAIPPAKPAVSPVVSEEEMRRREIVDAHAKLDQQNHYDVLGLSRSSTKEAIHRQYFTLVKVYHPDNQFNPHLLGEGEKLEALFQRIRTAYAVLSSPDKRKQYDASLDAGPADRVAAAREDEERRALQKRMALANFDAARAYVRGGNMAPAVSLLEAAMQYEPERHDFVLLMAQALAGTTQGHKRAAELFEKVIEQDPTSLEALLGLAGLYEAKGLRSRALEVYRQAQYLDTDSSEIGAALARLKKPAPK